MTLSELYKGNKAKILDFMPEVSPTQREWAMNMGLYSGNEICCYRQENFQSPAIYQIGNFSLAIDRDITSKILISQID